MSLRRFAPLAAVLLVLALVGASLSGRSRNADDERLESSPNLRWYRGNMHTHSHWSDGDDYLENIALWYREHEYDFLVFTDHNVLANTERWVAIETTKGGKTAFDKLIVNFPDWIETREAKGFWEVRLHRFDEVSERLNQPGEFLLIQGEEISDSHAHYPVHLNASNVQEHIHPHGGASVRETIQNNVDAVLAQRAATGQPMIVHLNHPNFGYAITAEDLAHVVGEKFFEVYNGHPGVHNSGDGQHASTERIWDIVLSLRLTELGLPVMYGLAVDDGHSYHNMPSRASEPGRGWVWVLAEELTAASLIEALEAGRFYASSGVRMRRVESTDRALGVEVDVIPGETYTIEFIGTRRGFNAGSEPVLGDDGTELHTTRSYSAAVGEVLKTVTGPTARYEFTGEEIYVRARITSSALHPNPSEEGEFQRAWVQPVIPGRPDDRE
jgi:hypothetical protein